VEPDQVPYFILLGINTICFHNIWNENKVAEMYKILG
jgi:hypothetical protein